MNSDNDKYDNPQFVTEWFKEQRDNIKKYLKNQNLNHGGLANEPDWSVTPYISVWKVSSKINPKKTGWWVISGDLPTDYCSSKGLTDSRSVLKYFSETWNEISNYMLRGEEHPEIKIGNPEDWPELGDLLRKRAKILEEWVEDDEMWE